MKNLSCFSLLVSVFVFIACQASVQNTSETKTLGDNPPALGFDVENSDAKAIAIADDVMKAMGGRTAYDSSRYIGWNFFNSRKLWWDKIAGDVRIESLRDDFKVKMNIHSMEGEVWKDSTLLTQPDSLNKYLQQGKNIWINDSYWLVMPFKLKDSGVTLSYVGEEKSDSLDADILELRFKNVGKTPDNKYQVYVDRETNLISQWAFFTKASDDTARFVTPWKNYQQHGDILLSGDRGKYQLTEIQTGLEVKNKLNEDLK